MARRGHSVASTSHGHRFDSELKLLAGCKVGDENGNAPVLGQTVQARLAPFLARRARNQ